MTVSPDRLARMTSMLGKTLGAAALAILLAGVPALAQDGSWRSTRAMDTARSNAAVAVHEGEIYVAGGASVIGPRDAFEVFDPRGEIWRPLAALPEGRERFGMAALGGTLYLSGGYEKEALEETADLWIYDTADNSWRRGPDMPAARAGHTMVTVEGRLYVIGGLGGDAARIFAFDPAAETWETMGWRLPEPRADLAAVVQNGAVYVIGGMSASGQSARMDRLDPQSGRWQAMAAMPRARSGHTAAILRGRLHVAGGVAPQALKTYAEHDVYDLATGRWSTAAPLPTPRHGLVSASLNDKWYVIGGGSGAGFFTVFTEAGAVEVFEPTAR